MIFTATFRFLYQRLAKPFFFRQDPEDVHDRMCALGERLGRCSGSRILTKQLFAFAHPALEQTILGIRFPNPIGLAAGFDKNAKLTQILPSVGFGFEEVGSITGKPCEGNPRPRLWRLPKSKGLVVYYGLKNDGCEAIANRLLGQKFATPLGTSVARTNDATTVGQEAGIADYAKAFAAFTTIGDYFTVNISCPNTCGGEPFTEPSRLEALMTALDKIETKKPVFVKISPDLSVETVDQLLTVAGHHRIHGFIISNLTKQRENPTIRPDEIRGLDKGGVSGAPVQKLANDLIAHIYRRSAGKYVLIGCGGVFSAEDAYEKIRRGASLIQLVTGMIFEGPQVIGEINRSLVRLLERDGFRNVSDAVGKE